MPRLTATEWVAVALGVFALGGIGYFGYVLLSGPSAPQKPAAPAVPAKPGAAKPKQTSVPPAAGGGNVPVETPNTAGAHEVWQPENIGGVDWEAWAADPDNPETWERPVSLGP